MKYKCHKFWDMNVNPITMGSPQGLRHYKTDGIEPAFFFKTRITNSNKYKG